MFRPKKKPTATGAIAEGLGVQTTKVNMSPLLNPQMENANGNLKLHPVIRLWRVTKEMYKTTEQYRHPLLLKMLTYMANDCKQLNQTVIQKLTCILHKTLLKRQMENARDNLELHPDIRLWRLNMEMYMPTEQYRHTILLRMVTHMQKDHDLYKLHQALWIARTTVCTHMPTARDDLHKARQPHIFIWANATKYAGIARLCFGTTNA